MLVKREFTVVLVWNRTIGSYACAQLRWHFCVFISRYVSNCKVKGKEPVTPGESRDCFNYRPLWWTDVIARSDRDWCIDVAAARHGLEVEGGMKIEAVSALQCWSVKCQNKMSYGTNVWAVSTLCVYVQFMCSLWYDFLNSCLDKCEVGKFSLQANSVLLPDFV